MHALIGINAIVYPVILPACRNAASAHKFAPPVHAPLESVIHFAL